MRPLQSTLVVEFREPLELPKAKALIAKIAPDATVRDIKLDGRETTFLLSSVNTQQVSKTVGQLEYEDGVVGGYLDMGGSRMDIHPKD